MWARIARLLGLIPKEPPIDAQLQDALGDAERTYIKMWRVTNESRIKRGANPIPPPSWDSLLGVDYRRK